MLSIWHSVKFRFLNSAIVIDTFLCPLMVADLNIGYVTC